MKKKGDESDISELIELLEEAGSMIEEAADILDEVANKVEGLPVGYNMGGNMRAYVINYLVGSRDSIVEKIQNYINELSELE